MGSILLFPFNVIAAVFELVFCIPIIGRITKGLWNLFLSLPFFLFGMVEYGLMALGFQPEKKMRVNVVILRDEDGKLLVDKDVVVEKLQPAINFFQSTANVRLVPATDATIQLTADGRFSSATEDWIHVSEKPSSRLVLDIACNLPAGLQDIWLTGMLFQFMTMSYFPAFNIHRLMGYAAPVTIFIVRNIKGHGGCSLGPFTDYVTIKYNQLDCIAHELGHACNNFKHSKDNTNLMYPSECGKTNMNLWQIALSRSSRHVTFF